MNEATHTDEYGNLYRVAGDKPQPYCVFFWHWATSQWMQDLGKDFSHLIKIS